MTNDILGLSDEANGSSWLVAFSISDRCRTFRDSFVLIAILDEGLLSQSARTVKASTNVMSLRQDTHGRMLDPDAIL